MITLCLAELLQQTGALTDRLFQLREAGDPWCGDGSVDDGRLRGTLCSVLL